MLFQDAPLGKKEVVDDNDEWLDNIALHVGATGASVSAFNLNGLSQATLCYNAERLPSFNFAATVHLDEDLRDIFRLLTTLEAPQLNNRGDSFRRPLSIL